MAKAWAFVAGLCVVLIGGVAGRAQGTTTASAPAPTKKVCQIISFPPTPAETALNRKDYKLAESLFRALLTKSPTSETAHEGLVRTLIEQDKVSDAAHEAEAWSASSPESSVAMDALAEVRVRQGDPAAGFTLFQKALRADVCDARAYYGLANVSRLAGRHAISKRLIEQAHALHPTDDEINTAWMSTRPRKERLDLWTAYAEHSDQISDEDRASLKTRLAKESLYHPSDCRMSATSPREAKAPMVPVMDGPSRFVAWGLDVQFNGKRRRLEIDTGASGITISRAAAMFMGIAREDVTSTGGIGDKGNVRTSVAHVASIKIGGMEFTNCAVEILEKFSLLDSDGLIGGDVFEDSQLTLDFPKQELRISPLPEPPGEKKPTAVLNTAGEDEDKPAHDPYIAPEMAKWQRIYRNGHELLIPGGIVETKRVKDDSAWKDTIFLLDTGSQSNLISPAAARAVTKVSRDDSVDIRGISGQVEKVFAAGKFTLAFAGLRLDSPSMTAIDTTKISHGAGMEVSGLIGAPALTLLALHIDYRDNLVWCEYSPPK